MKEMKRIISMVLCLVMILSLLPMGAVRVNAADTIETGAVVDAAIMFSDLHTNKSDYKKDKVEGIMAAFKNTGLPFTSVTSCGDAFSVNEDNSYSNGPYDGSTKTITGYILGTDGLGDSTVDVNYVWSDHDRYAYQEDGETLLDKTSYLAYEGNYYVYALSMGDLCSYDRYKAGFNYSSTNNSGRVAAGFTATVPDAIQNFKNTVAKLDKTKPLLIASHQPLFDNRNDNAWAELWFEAINEVAAEMDVVFFFGHNHKYDNEADYYYAKGTKMPVALDDRWGWDYDVGEGYLPSMDLNSKNETLNFTHLCAGYLEPTSTGSYKDSTTRLGTAVAVTIYEDYIGLTTYNASGKYTGNYAVDELVKRDHAPEDVPEQDPTLTSIAVTTAPTTVEYTVGDTFSAEGLVVTATYTNGSTEAVTGYTLSEVDMTTAGEKEVTVTYEGMTATFKITVKAAEPTNNTVECWDNTNQVKVVATGLGLTAVTATNVTGKNEKCDEIFTEYGYAAFDIALTGLVEGEFVDYSISVVPDLDITNLELYYIDENDELTPVECRVTTDELNNVYVEFTADYDGTFVYGSPKVPDGYVLTSLTLANIPYDVFKGTTVDLTKAVITATYTMEGAEDFGRNLTIYDYDSETAFSGFDVNEPGDQTVVFTFEGLTATAPIYVWDSALSNGGVSVALSGAEFGVTGVTAVESTNTHVADAVANVMSSYVAYDISLVYEDGYAATEDTKTVTLPVPEGVVNPVVYYVSDNGYNVVDMKATVSEDGKTVSFETKHFSTYVVGENTEIEVPVPDTATGSVGGKKTVYKLTTSISTGNDYLIVDTNSAGDANILARNGSSYSNTTATVVSDSNGTYIVLEDATDELWTYDTVTSGSGYWSETYNTFKNGDYYLYYTSSGSGMNQTRTLALTTSTPESSWSYSNNQLTIRSRYLTGGSSWSLSSTQSNVYFYVATEIDNTISGTYSIVGTDENVAAIKDATVDLTSTLVFTPTSGDATTTVDPEGVTYEVYEGGDPLGVISGIDGNTVTLSGKVGKALVKVSYDTNGDAEGGVVTDYITVTTTTPDHYSIQLHLNEGGTLGEEITKPVALKGIEAGDAYSVWAVVKAYVSAEDTEGVDIGTLGDALTWTVTDPSIATIDTNTGDITFTGNKYGTFDVTVAYEGADKKPYTDTITISATKSLYVVPGDGTNDFPEYPNQGAVRFDKTATAVGNYSQTGIAKVELSMTGVPIKKGTDVIIMLDTSSSMNSNKVTGTNKTRLTVLQESLAKLIAQLQTKDADGNFMDIKVAIADFNGYYGNGVTEAGAQSGTPYDRTAGDYVKNGNQNGSGYNQHSQAQVYTGSKALNAGAFVPVGQLPTSYDLNFVSGTNYDYAFDAIYQLGTAIKASNTENRELIVVFMSDGASLQWNYFGTENGYTRWNSWITGTWKANDLTTSNLNSTTHSYFYDLTDHDGDGQLNEHRMANAIKGDPSKRYEVIRKTTAGLPEGTLVSAGKDYLYTVPGLGATMYTINFDAKQDGQITEESIDKALSSTASDKTGTTQYYYKVTSADQLDAAFKTIGHAITYAATNVKVEDKIGNDYTLNFKLPTGVTNTEAGMSEFYIQVLEYQLDSDKERTGTPAVLENFTFDANGALKTHTVNGAVTCEGIACTHVTFTTGRVTGINGTHFTYTCAPKLDANGNVVKNEVGDTITEEYLTWNADKLTTTELVLEYFAYLDNSAGYDADDQVPAGTYYTNEYATLTYKNYLGNEVQREFPIPQMTWNGAQVTYVFYLVNDAGHPVNRAGRVIPFAESVYVTDPVTFNVTWNEQTGSENILAHDIFAEAGVPEVYELYDDSAQYVIRVYQTEDVDKEGVNGNYFQISGDDNKRIDSALDIDTDKNNSTTVVFNTKTGVKYDKYGIYSIYEEGTPLTNGTTYITTTVKADDIDYANTTVAFAVVWKPELVEDTVVIDYGLDVVIDVIKNDNMAAGVVGVRTDAPKSGSEDVKINSGSFTSAKEQTVDVYIDTNNDTDGLKELKIGTAKVENLNQVRFSLNKDNGMQFTDPAVFYYEADVNYYDSKNVLQTTSMYSSVTVIPATTVYYEDKYVDLKVQTQNEDKSWSDNPNLGWTRGNAIGATQAQDRPGESKISETLDADNIYGYDAAYKEMSTYSLGSAAKLNVKPGKRGIATFEFYGTGFDIISVTSNTTGTIRVQVDGNVKKSHVVDTYYGYEKNKNGEWEVSPNNPKALYQIPVMKVSGLPYGKYTVTITAAYGDIFDHDQTCTCGTEDCTGCYELYLDAIRIYDPTGNQSDVANKAYEADGEAYPEYYELRNKIIEAKTFNSANSNDVNGIVFIDCDDEVDTAAIADYVSFGPNNEVYLAKDQAIAFALKAPDDKEGHDPDKIHIGLKSVGGTAKVKISYVNGNEVVTAFEQELATATDMYYDITALDDETVVIESVGDAILSITNVKFTYKTEVAAASGSSSSGSSSSSSESAVAEEAISPFTIRMEDIEVILAYLNKSVEEEIIPEVPEVTEPETEAPTEPEVTEPETEPEATEPDVTEPETEPAKPSKPTKVDTAELKAAVEAAKKLKEKDYTKESFKALDKAVKSAEKVLKDKKVTQEKIDKALVELNEAVEALEANVPAAKPGKDEKPNQNKPGKEEKPEKEMKPAKTEKPADNKPVKPENNNQNKPANNKGPAAAVEHAQKLADTVGAIAEALFGWMFR